MLLMTGLLTLKVLVRIIMLVWQLTLEISLILKLVTSIMLINTPTTILKIFSIKNHHMLRLMLILERDLSLPQSTATTITRTKIKL